MTMNLSSVETWSFGGIATVIAAIFVFLFVLDRRGKRRHTPTLNHPEFDLIEQHFNYVVSPSLRALYANKALINSSHIVLGLPNRVTNEEECFIAAFDPITLKDAKIYHSNQHGQRKGLFIFATNGAGDEFLVDPRQPDPEVIYLVHGTKKMAPMGLKLSQFIAAPRRPVPEE